MRTIELTMIGLIGAICSTKAGLLNRAFGHRAIFDGAQDPSGKQHPPGVTETPAGNLQTTHSPATAPTSIAADISALTKARNGVLRLIAALSLAICCPNVEELSSQWLGTAPGDRLG